MKRPAKVLVPEFFTAPNTAKFWTRVALPDENGCMLWLGTLTPDGYGIISIADRVQSLAHRYSLWWSAGPSPVERPLAAHSCRSRHCVAPLHLRWATHTENVADAIRDDTWTRGDRHPASRLTNEAVREIRERYALGGVSQRALAGEYGVHQLTISRVIRYVAWRSVS